MEMKTGLIIILKLKVKLNAVGRLRKTTKGKEYWSLMQCPVVHRRVIW